MRWGLVLGGGGILGGSWMAGALAALEHVHGLDAREADLIVGTSAGSVTAAMLGAGVSVDQIVAHQMGDDARAGKLAGIDWDYDNATGGHLPPRPKLLGPGSASLVARNARRLTRMPPTVLLAALLPEGRGHLDTVGTLIRGLVPRGWAPHPGLRAVAMDFESGRRVAFGDPGAPAANLADAVMASCSIPGWYAPMTISGRRYVDGGACSCTNVDLAAGLGLDEVFVLAPMVSFATDRPTNVRARMERQWRERITRRCLREVAKVHRGGTDVTVVGPGPEDLELIGGNLMASDRRHAVLQMALRTTRAALVDPESLAHLPPAVTEAEQDVHVDAAAEDLRHLDPDGGRLRAHLESTG
jgi:NTE family protein